MFSKTNNEEKERKMEYGTPIETVIGTGAKLEGTLTVQGDVRVEGEIQGNVNVDGNLIIGSNGHVDGEIVAKNAKVAGYVKGNLYIEEKIEFQSGARFEGELECKGLIVQDGVTFDGTCRMTKKRGRPEKQGGIKEIIKEEE